MTVVRFEDRRPFFTEDEVIKAYADKEKRMAKAMKNTAQKTTA